MLDDGLPSATTQQQNALEKKLLALYQELDSMEPEDVTECLRLLRTVHITYLHAGLGKLPASFAALGASRPWIVYWIVHSLALLEADLPANGPTAANVAAFLSACQPATGGYGGGPMQLPHLAPTYAAVCALATLGSEAVLQTVDRVAMHRFLCSLIVPPEKGGGFCIHEGGEVDLRACYLAIATAHILCLDVQALAEASGVVQYIQQCQTYEGGLGGEPFNEAHGGYTFCGLATLFILGKTHVIDLSKLLHWAAARQCSMEGGFNGRTNKLVDGCYSFWQGGLFALLQRLPQQALQPPLPQVQAPAAVLPGAFQAAPLPPFVPPLPFTAAKSPVEQAAAVFSQKQQAAQQIIGAALQAGERADNAMQTGTERSTAVLTAEARVLMDQAGAAQAEAETAHLNIGSANNAACSLFPMPDPSDPPFPTVQVVGNRTVPLGPPLYNFKALQLWILRCCQALRGGLKDKPGKPPDYYHTCYCLSGLSSAQHLANYPLGPRENLLKRADPAVNVVEEKLEAARRYFSARPINVPLLTSGGPQPMSGSSAGSTGRKTGKMDLDEDDM